MKHFFQTMFASVFGVLIALGLLILGGISFLVGIAVSSSSSTEYKPKDDTVFRLELEGTLSDQAVENPFSALLGEEAASMSLADVIKAIRKAKTNDKIKGIYLDAGAMSGGYAGFEAIRRELEDFKESGKFIVSYADAYTQGAYYLASVADSVFVNPQGTVALTGLAYEGIFIKNLSAKAGIEYNIFKVGTYKSAVEPFMTDKFSDANREQLTSFLGNLWGNMTAAVCASRGIAPADLDNYLDQGPMFGEAMVDCKLVDALAYRKEAEDCVKRMAGQSPDDKMVSAGVKKMLAITGNTKESDNKIAVLYAEGEISEGGNPVTGMDEAVISEDMAEELDKLAGDDEVKAVVFRVNSPGGSAYVSEQIWKAVVDLKAKKPVVVSMGDYAASGGYYISCAANKIVAERGTLTGSIGVFGIIPNLAGTFKLLDVTTDIVKTGPYADFGDVSRPMREDEKALVQKKIESMYDLFLTRCSDGRGIPKDSIDHIGQGRVWTGEQALELGLVDKLGGMDVAVEEAASLAGVAAYTVTVANTKKNFFTEYMEKMIGEAKVSLIRSALGNEEFAVFSNIRRMKSQTGIQARMPYLIQGL